MTSFDLVVYYLIEVYGGSLFTEAESTDTVVDASALYADRVYGSVVDPLSAVYSTLQSELDIY